MMDLRCERWEKFEHRCPPMPHSYKKLMDLEMMMMVMMMMMTTLPTIVNYMKDINWSGNDNHHHPSFILIMIRTSQMFWRYDDGDDMWWFMERLKVLKWWARSSLSWVGVGDHIRAALRQITSPQHPQPPLASYVPTAKYVFSLCCSHIWLVYCMHQYAKVKNDGSRRSYDIKFQER